MKKIVFLDYDGVVNRKMWTCLDGKWVCRYGYPEDGCVNDGQAVQWVSEFCEKYGFDIVVTSTWRKYPEWEISLRGGGLRDSVKILGSTPLPTKDRADEISEYLTAHPEIEEYLVFDDKETLSESVHSPRLVLCKKERGFGEEEYDKAVEICLKEKEKR